MSWPHRKSVLVPIDLSEPSLAALDEALTMVAAPSDVHVIHVLPDLDTDADFIGAAFDVKRREAGAKAALTACIGPTRKGVQAIIGTGMAGDVIAETAEKLGCDLIVIPSHARSGLARFFLGSVAERVLRHATCPVLVLRAG